MGQVAEPRLLMLPEPWLLPSDPTYKVAGANLKADDKLPAECLVFALGGQARSGGEQSPHVHVVTLTADAVVVSEDPHPESGVRSP